MRLRATICCVFLVGLAACSSTDPSQDNRVDGGIVIPNGDPNVADPDAGTGGPVFRVASFNARRAFDTECQSGRCESGDFENQLSEAEFNFKIEQLAEGIRSMEADAVLLQEIESEAVLVALYGQLDDIYNIAIIGEIGGTATLDTAIIARGDYLGTIGHRDTQLTRPDGSTTGFTREFLEVRLTADGVPIHLFAAHFKSKRNDDPGRRIAEAEGARDIAVATAAANPESLVIVGGDLNDTPDSVPLETMTAGGFLELVNGPADDWWTYGFGQERNAIDHILSVPNERFRARAPITIYRNNGGGFASSDHAAISADFELPAN